MKVLISENDPTYQKHKKVLVACLEAGIEDLPKETAKYFDCKYPDPCLIEEKLEAVVPLTEFNENDQSGFILMVKDIPQGAEKIKVYLSY